MASHIYNALPTVEDAHERFRPNKDAVLASLVPLISKYNNKYGVNLVHQHVQLEPGEITLSKSDGVTEPVRNPTVYHPERWLASGVPYEFSVEKVGEAPPPEFFAEFRSIVGEDSPLGVFVVDPNAPDVQTEVVDGRTSTFKAGPPQNKESSWVETAWVPGSPNKLFFCLFLCICP